MSLSPTLRGYIKIEWLVQKFYVAIFFEEIPHKKKDPLPIIKFGRGQAPAVKQEALQ